MGEWWCWDQQGRWVYEEQDEFHFGHAEFGVPVVHLRGTAQELVGIVKRCGWEMKM